MVLLANPECEVCKKARQWLDDNGYAYEYRDITVDAPDADELYSWHMGSGLPPRYFWGPQKFSFRAMRLYSSLYSLDAFGQCCLIAASTSFIAHPILIDGSKLLVGFSSISWEKKLSNKKSSSSID